MLAAARMLKNVNFTSRQIVPIRIEPDDSGIRLTLVDADSNGVQHLDMDAVYAILRGEDVPCGRWRRA